MGGGGRGRRRSGQLPSFGYKGQGEPRGLEALGGGGEEIMFAFPVPLPPLRPAPSPCLPAPNIGAIDGAPHQLPALPSLQPAPSVGPSPRGGPSCTSRCGRHMLGEGKKGSLTPSLLHHPQMMKPRQRLRKGHRLGVKGASLVPILLPSPPPPNQNNCSIRSPHPSLVWSDQKAKDNFKGRFQGHINTLYQIGRAHV